MSYAGETKFATMLMPMVATMKVTEPRITTKGLPIFCTMSTGSMMAVPKTFSVPAVTMTVMIEKTRKLTGRPRKLPFLMVGSSLPKRAKSPKFNSRAAK